MQLAIGTVQFGLNYGVANTQGKTSEGEAARILEVGRHGGLDTLDTAFAYGDSEAVLGRLGVDSWKVISKVPPLSENKYNGQDWVLGNLRCSLARLSLNRVDGLMLHHAEDLLGPEGKNIMVGLLKAKEQGLVDKVGWSIYSPTLLPQLLKHMVPDLIQAPLNILDQRLVKSGWLNRLAEREVEVHTRSTFLQGLLLMRPSERPDYFKPWNDVLGRWDAFVGEHGGCPKMASLSYVKNLSNVSRVVVGVESSVHLEQLLAAWMETTDSVSEGLACDDVGLIEPSRWRLK